MKWCQVVNMLPKVQEYLLKKAKTVKKRGLSYCLLITAILWLVPMVIVAVIYRLNMTNRNYFTMYIDTQDDPFFIVNDKFISLGLDSSVIARGFPHFNMTDPVLVQMMKYLSPAYLRIGGNQADQIVFLRNADGTSGEDVHGQYSNSSNEYYLKAPDWLSLYNTVTSANLNIIYDLNSLLRNEDGAWNATNAIEMLEFSKEHGLFVNWELGNEPNSYPHKFGTSVNATQLGEDYKFLRSVLDKYDLYKNSYLIGPSTTRLRTKDIQGYFREFLQSGSEAVSAITFHHYYFSGETAIWTDFLDVENFDYLASCIDTVKDVLGLIPDLDKPLWIGETADAWHGGAPNLTDRYIGSFLWLDKLGLSAKMGIDVVVRQSIFNGHYALMNDSYYPNPDWWLSILYKTLVSPKVLATTSEGDLNIRLYAHCAKDNPLWSNKSAIVVFGVNLSFEKGFVQLKELRADPQIFVYEFTSESTLFSQFVQLNNVTLLLESNLILPDFEPRVVEQQSFDSLEMRPLSIVFWVFANTNVDACKLP
ncbi:heparanase-like [Anthonomus grandis grandis]|uniref:heparanase-like n=1 Tax=Anthonomus grandis grandis TaxID=2921223 RepID=UPI00216536A2|nr:heparanase-like [Anthonomus grandis grandis]